jgi:hypothetical protein
MKKLISLFVIFLSSVICMLTLADIGWASSQGVDAFRGAWGGTLSAKTPSGQSSNVQLNLYFNESVPGDKPGSFKASGYSSILWQEPRKPKRAKTQLLPMMAKYTQTGASTFDVTILAMSNVPPWIPSPGTILFRMIGTVNIYGSGVSGDIMQGQWSAQTSNETIISNQWSAVHLDRRRISASPMDLNDPTLNLSFNVDVYAGLNGPKNIRPQERNPSTILGAMSNIVMDSVQVTHPDGKRSIIPNYTDVFTPGVDWVSMFRFNISEPTLPVAGGTYVFTALDVAGNPIPGVEASDVWVGVGSPDPPTNVRASLNDNGISVAWDDVSAIPDSFQPDAGLGFYQIELSGQPGMVYGASGLSIPNHLVPKYRINFDSDHDYGLSLDEMDDGTYSISVCVHSVAPTGSAGHGFEYNVHGPSDQNILFKIDSGVITITDAGFISGLVTGGGTPLANLQLHFYNATTNQFINGTRTGVDGTYTIKQPVGSYLVEAAPSVDVPPYPYLDEFYDGVSTMAQATPVAVTAGATATNIDFSLLTK